jgi:hypothetical protein
MSYPLRGQEERRARSTLPSLNTRNLALSKLARLSAFIILLLTLTAATLQAAPPARGLKICVASDAPEPIRHAAQSILDQSRTNPLLSVMCGKTDNTAASIVDSKTLLAAKPAARAYDHLILVGTLTDPLIQAASQHEARPDESGIYVFGFGHLRGDIGYVESDRNPFLHSRLIRAAPYETEVITITGTTPAGVALAVEAFLKKGLINGVVAAPGWARPETSLLDHDPLAPAFALPDWLPLKVGNAIRIGVSQGGEDEYRGVLETTGVEPREIWRAKFYVPGSWDGAGVENAYDNYSAGLHRRAYGNTLWCARFDSASQAAQAAPKIAGDAKLKKVAWGWTGKQPPYGPQKDSPGPLALVQHAEWLLMSTLPHSDTDDLHSAIR